VYIYIYILNHIIALKELVSCDQQLVEKLSEIEGINEILVELIRKQISQAITKALIVVIFHMVSSSNEKIKLAFVKMGFVSSLLEIIFESEKSICERALGVFDGLCSCKEGREEAQSNALTVPVLVKKILRMSELATVFSISAILNLCKYGRSSRSMRRATISGRAMRLSEREREGYGLMGSHSQKTPNLS
jgi:hypothetical protein